MIIRPVLTPNEISNGLVNNITIPKRDIIFYNDPAHPNSTTGSTINDQSGNGNNMTLDGNKKDMYDGVYELNGVNDYIVFSDMTTLFPSNGAATIAMWVQFRDVSTRQTIFSGYGSGTNRWDTEISIGELNAGWHDDGFTQSPGFNFQEGEWYHFSMTMYPNSHANWYVNGVRIATKECREIDAVDGLGIGRRPTNTNFYLSGSIGPIAIYERELRPEEINILYHAHKDRYQPRQLNKEGLVIHLDTTYGESWPNSGSTWYDISGNGNNCTLYNTTYTENSNGYGGYFVFNGSTAYGQIANTGESWTDGVTVIALVEPQQSTHVRPVINQQNSTSTGHCWRILTASAPSGGGVSYQININNAQSDSPFANGDAIFDHTSGERHFVVGSYDPTSGTSKLKIGDRNLDTDTNGTPGSALVNTDGVITLGINFAYNPDRYLAMNLWSVMVYNRVLSDQEIGDIYQILRSRHTPTYLAFQSFRK